MNAIRWQGDSLALLDQTKLPVEEVWEDYTDYRKVADAIRRLVVRGAPAIGIAAAYAVCLAAMELQCQDTAQFRAGMARAAKELAASRPTAVNLFWALDSTATCSSVLPATCPPAAAGRRPSLRWSGKRRPSTVRISP